MFPYEWEIFLKFLTWGRKNFPYLVVTGLAYFIAHLYDKFDMATTFLEVLMKITSSLSFEHFDLLLDIDEIAIHSIKLLLPFKGIDPCFQNPFIFWFSRYFVKSNVLALRTEKVDLCVLSLKKVVGGGISHQITSLSLVFCSQLLFWIFASSHEVSTGRHYRVSLDLNTVYYFISTLELIFLSARFIEFLGTVLIIVIAWEGWGHELKITTIEFLVD